MGGINEWVSEYRLIPINVSFVVLEVYPQDDTDFDDGICLNYG